MIGTTARDRGPLLGLRQADEKREGHPAENTQTRSARRAGARQKPRPPRWGTTQAMPAALGHGMDTPTREGVPAPHITGQETATRRVGWRLRRQRVIAGLQTGLQSSSRPAGKSQDGPAQPRGTKEAEGNPGSRPTERTRQGNIGSLLGLLHADVQMRSRTVTPGGPRWSMGKQGGR